MPRNRYLRDRMIRRRDNADMRNPYGSRGGYVSSSRSDRDRYDSHDMDRAMRGDTRYRDGYSDGYRDGYRSRDNDSDSDMSDYDMDRAEEDFEQELDKWCKQLKETAKQPISKNEALQKAEYMGVKFDKYNEKEFYTVVNMLMNDFPNMGQPETYIAMAKQWLEDKDAELQGSEKLAAYYYTIVKGE